MGQEHARRVTILNIALNALLFILKLGAGLVSGSFAVMADAANSALDLLHGLGTFWAVNESHKRADRGHPFGHARAEPMVAFTISILMAITAFEFLRGAVFNLVRGGNALTLNWVVVAVLLVCVAAKILLSHEALTTGKETKSPALLATAADARNDVLVTLTALAGVALGSTTYAWLDETAAIIIAGFILWSAFQVGRENMQYLLGAAPPKELQRKVRELATTVHGVRGVHLVKAHYVGNYVHVEVHIAVSQRTKTKASHAIATTVQHDIEQLSLVSKAFVHVEPA